MAGVVVEFATLLWVGIALNPVSSYSHCHSHEAAGSKLYLKFVVAALLRPSQ